MSADTLEVLGLDTLTAAPDAARPLPADPSKDAAPGVCAFDGCTNGLPKPAGGRGRPAKFCDAHKGGKGPKPDAPGFSSSRSGLSGKSWPKAAEVETLLTQYVNGLGIALSFVHEKDGAVIIAGGPDVVHELVELAKDERELRKYLEWLTTPGKYAPLTLAVAGVAIPLMANHGLIQIDLSKILGPRGGGTK